MNSERDEVTPERPALVFAEPSGTPSFRLRARAEAEAIAAANGDTIRWVTIHWSVEDPIERVPPTSLTNLSIDEAEASLRARIVGLETGCSVPSIRHLPVPTSLQKLSLRPSTQGSPTLLRDQS